MKNKHLKMYMEIAECLARASSGVRLKVGAVLVKDNNILSTGYNALPAAIDGPLEYKEYMKDAGGWLDSDYIEQEWPLLDTDGNRYKLVTKPEVRHAERQTLMNLCKTNESAIGSTLFVTESPCFLCSVDIVDAGIIGVYYKNKYRCSKGLEYLIENGILVEQFNE